MSSTIEIVLSKLPKALDGWVIHKVGMIDRYRYLVIGQWNNDDEDNPFIAKDGKKYDHPTRMLCIDIQNNKIKWYESYDGWSYGYCDGGTIGNNKVAFFGSGNGITYALDYNADTFKHEDLLMHPDTFKTNSQRTIRGIRFVGNDFYTLSTGNEVHRRDDVKKWTFLSPEPNEYYKKISEDNAQGLAAFSEKEIYFCGEKGAVWSYDGKHWDKATGISEEMDFTNIECCSDGKVYVIDHHARGVAIGKGKDFKLTLMKENDPGKGLIYDTCTFNGKVYMTTHAIYEFKHDAWVKANIPSIYGSVEHLAAKDGVMFIGTPYSLKIYNGKETFTLYGESTETEKLLGQRAMDLALELIDNKEEIVEMISDSKK